MAPNRTPVITRLLSRVEIDPETECWEWQGGRTRSQYGRLKGGDGRTRRAHRLAWELLVGAIPEGMLVCHHCDNPPCCNPDHLFIGTSKDNQLDASTKKRHSNSRKTHCPLGHPYDVIRSNGRRSCRTCFVAQRRLRAASRRKSKSESAFRSVAEGRHANANKTHCPHGHEYTAENTIVVSGPNRRNHRACRACRVLAEKRRGKRRRKPRAVSLPVEEQPELLGLVHEHWSGSDRGDCPQCEALYGPVEESQQ